MITGNRFSTDEIQQNISYDKQYKPIQIDGIDLKEKETKVPLDILGIMGLASQVTRLEKRQP